MALNKIRGKIKEWKEKRKGEKEYNEKLSEYYELKKREAMEGQIEEIAERRAQVEGRTEAEKKVSHMFPEGGKIGKYTRIVKGAATKFGGAIVSDKGQKKIKKTARNLQSVGAPRGEPRRRFGNIDNVGLPKHPMYGTGFKEPNVARQLNFGQTKREYTMPNFYNQKPLMKTQPFPNTKKKKSFELKDYL